MKVLLVVIFFGVVAAQRGSRGLPFFTNSEVNELLSDSSYVKKQITCVLGKAKCDSMGNQLKLAIPEVLGRNCRSCDEQQAKNAKKLTEFMRVNFPDEFSQILKKYRIKQTRSYGRR